MQALKLIGENSLLINYLQIFSFKNQKSPHVQTLRWKRKPIWLPTAKSKVFRIPSRPNIPIAEQQEIQRLYNNYRTKYRSIRKYFIDTVKASEIEFDRAKIKKAEKKDFEECYKINQCWNQEIEKQRIERWKLEDHNKKERIVELVKQKELKNERIVKEIDKKVKEMNRLVPTFITRENIDHVLENVLNETIDYNVAIDIEGKWLKEDLKTQQNSSEKNKVFNENNNEL